MDKKTMLTEKDWEDSEEFFNRSQFPHCREILQRHSHYASYDSSTLASCNNDEFQQLLLRSSIANSNATTIMDCIIEQNIHVCTFMTEGMSLKPSLREMRVLFGRFGSLLVQLTDCIPEPCAGLVAVVLHNYLVTHLHLVSVSEEGLQTDFMLISTVLKKAFKDITGSDAGIEKPVVEEIVALLDLIFDHADSMSKFELKAFRTVCPTIFFSLFLRKKFIPVQNMKKLLSKIEVTCERKQKEKREEPSFVCIPAYERVSSPPSYSDWLQLLLACSSIAANELHASYLHLEKISNRELERIAGYMKAFLRFNEKQYDDVFEICWTLWKRRKRDFLDFLMSALLSNLIGCCLLNKGCYDCALLWFEKSFDYDSTCLIPLWNLALAFQCLGKENASLKTLEVLEKASIINSDKHNSLLVCNMLQLENAPGISHMQALYLLAHQSLLYQRYSQTAEHFMKLLPELKKTPLKNLPHSGHFPISLPDIFVEASYACLNAGRYNDCLELGNSAPEFFAASSCPGKISFSSNDGEKVQGKLHFKSKVKHPPPVADPPDISPSGSNSPHLVQIFGGQSSSLHLGNENEEAAMDTECSEFNTDEKVPCSHDHVQLRETMHMMIQASAKYELDYESESYDILKRALSTIRHQHEIEENAEEEFLTERNQSVESCSEEFCTVCSNYISSLYSQIYNNLAIIDVSKNHLEEAGRNLRLALMHDSGNVDAIYSYCLLQIKLGRVNSAQTFWEASKLRCDKLRAILFTDDDGDSTCTSYNALVKNLNEAFSSSA